MDLAQEFIVKAQNELNESDDIKVQSLDDFRTWLARHDYFIDCRKGDSSEIFLGIALCASDDIEFSLFLDDKFLLQFLRTRKYRMDKSKALFENYMLLKSSVPRWYDFTDEAISKLWNLYETGAAYPLTQRDHEGRRIIFIQTRKMDPKIFSSTDAIRLLTWIVRVILEEEETQISGIITIIDQSEISFAHLRLLSVNDAIDFVSVMKHATVGRQKGMYMIALPSFATFMLEIAKKATNEKLRQRIHVVEDMEKMKSLIDPSLLPSEHGGSVSEAHMMDAFRKIANERENDLKAIQEGVDWDRVALDGENSCAMM